MRISETWSLLAQIELLQAIVGLKKGKELAQTSSLFTRFSYGQGEKLPGRQASKTQNRLLRKY